jgi:hypothetical protein
MGNIYWLASYPKSGNTWTRILLTNYLRNADQPANINDLDGGPIASARQIFDDYAGVEASDLTQDEIERYRPFVYEQISAQATKPLYLKTHDAFTYTKYGYPLISKKATAGVIYLLRNPLDVAVSFAHHNASNVKSVARNMNNPNFAFVDDPQQLRNQLRQRLLTWSGHIASWVDEPDLRALTVRYEDLQADTAAALTAIIRFCGLEVDAARIKKAVRFSQFDEAQKQEAERGFDEKMPLAKNFFRKGQVGAWREELPPNLAKKLIADHTPMMLRFGYLNENAEPRY